MKSFEWFGVLNLKFRFIAIWEIYSKVQFFSILSILPLDRGQTLYFTWAEWNANEKNPLFFLISIRFGSCEVRRLTRALVYQVKHCLYEIVDSKWMPNLCNRIV